MNALFHLLILTIAVSAVILPSPALAAERNPPTPYRVGRSVVMAPHGMVATSQPLAAQVGLDILKQGGNAIDAAIATAATLTVVEPTSNGIGGDAFALIWVKDQLHGLNASGPAPQSISVE